MLEGAIVGAVLGLAMGLIVLIVRAVVLSLRVRIRLYRLLAYIGYLAPKVLPRKCHQCGASTSDPEQHPGYCCDCWDRELDRRRRPKHA